MSRTGQILAFVVIVTVGVTHGADLLPQNPDTLLAMLRAKDAQFDNLAADFERRTKVKDLDGSVESPLATVEREAIADCYLVIRGEETTYTNVFRTDHVGKPLDTSTPRATKTSNAAGVQQNMTVINELRIFHDDTRPEGTSSVLRKQRMLDEFCLGVGYGTRIQTIDRIQIKDGDALVEATMRLFREDTTKALLEIDSDLLVRKATMTATNPDGGQTRFEISNEGLSDSPEGATVAKRGVLKWTTLGTNRVVEDYSLSLTRIEHSLTPGTYKRMIDLKRSTATHTVDMTPRSAEY